MFRLAFLKCLEFKFEESTSVYPEIVLWNKVAVGGHLDNFQILDFE